MAERIVPSESTLVKYDNPVLVTRHEKKTPKKTTGVIGGGMASTVATAAMSAAMQQASGSAPGGSGLPAGAQDIPGLLRQGETSHRETDEILSAILPPREWEEDGQLWRQCVSNTPATRLDVINLQEQLDMRLQQRQARETGICPIRRQLYTQCFDELIRQVTINCAERGLLMLRVRDEIRMTIAAYQTLYESSIAFGMRKALMSEQGKADLETTVGTLVKQKNEFERQVVELRAKAEQIERRAKELQQAEEKKHSEEIDFFKRTNQQLKSQLEGIIAPKKQ